MRESYILQFRLLNSVHRTAYRIQVGRSNEILNCLVHLSFQDLSIHIWDPQCQRVVDEFRITLEGWHYGTCDVSNHFLSFYRKTRRNVMKCSHCPNAVVSKFGAQNGMDPGSITLPVI